MARTKAWGLSLSKGRRPNGEKALVLDRRSGVGPLDHRRESATAASSKSRRRTRRKAATARAGGTIVSELTTDIDYTDPQLSYYAPAWELEYATACKLMNYPDAEARRAVQ